MCEFLVVVANVTFDKRVSAAREFTIRGFLRFLL